MDFLINTPSNVSLNKAVFSDHDDHTDHNDASGYTSSTGTLFQSISSEQNIDSSGNDPPATRVSLRTKVQPKWLKDYITHKPNSMISTSQTNDVLLNCLINENKFNYQHYSSAIKPLVFAL